MPEYLAPGVYIEERPGQRTIEGVSTSTAGFVGMTLRGPIEGPPVLVTSVGEFQRQFGGVLPVRVDARLGEHGHLPLAIQQFFDNGGRRAFVSRAYRQTGEAIVAGNPQPVAMTDARRLRLATGCVARLRSSAPVGVETIAVSSFRGFSAFAAMALFSARDTPTPGRTITAANVNTHELTLSGALDRPTGELRAGTAYVHLVAPTANAGPTLIAREVGCWGESVEVQVRPINGTPVALTAAPAAGAAAGSTVLAVSSALGFYVGCTIELFSANRLTGAPGSVAYATVIGISANNLTIGATTAALPQFVPIETVVSLAEVEVLIRWDSVVERFAGSWRWIDPAVAPPPGFTAADIPVFNQAHSVWAQIDRRSTLVAVSEAAAPRTLMLGAPYDPADPLGSHPTTPTGHPTPLEPHPTLFQINGQRGPRGTPDALPQVPDYVGSLQAGPGTRTGIAALTDEETISIVAVPGITAVGVQSALITHAENMRYRFAVLDGPPEANIAAIRSHRGNFDSRYAAIYHPWVEVTEPRSGEPIRIPPSGPTIGIYARSDNERGVHKAPANEVVRNARDPATRVLFGEQEVLNPEGINVIRDFRPQNRGIRVWGARTISSDPQWKYVNVRRLFNYIESSIDRGSQWVVFEPNNQDLWARVRRTIETFLEATWRTGALFGAKAEDAFYVKCDRSTMSIDDITNGRIVVEIGIAPTRPAEFVIFRISQLTADARVNS